MHQLHKSSYMRTSWRPSDARQERRYSLREPQWNTRWKLRRKQRERQRHQWQMPQPRENMVLVGIPSTPDPTRSIRSGGHRQGGNRSSLAHAEQQAKRKQQGTTGGSTHRAWTARKPNKYLTTRHHNPHLITTNTCIPKSTWD